MISLTKDEKEKNLLCFLSELKKHFDDLTFLLQRDIDDKNTNIILQIRSNCFAATEEFQQNIKDIISLQKDAKIYQLLQTQLKQIINGSSERSFSVYKFPNNFEAILWLLIKFGLFDYYGKLKGLIKKKYGEEIVSRLEDFNNIDKIALDNLFETQPNQENLQEYLDNIKNLYFSNQNLQDSQNEKKSNPAQFVCLGSNLRKNSYKDIPNDFEEKKVDHSSQSMNSEYDSSLLIDGYCKSQSSEEISLNKSLQGKLEDKIRILNSSIVLQNNQNMYHVNFIKGVKSESIERYKNLQQSLKMNGELFTDSEFPPKVSSITQSVNKYPIAQEIVWKRIPEVYQKREIFICSDIIGPNDIHQGKLGNCFFLSALSALADQKQYIQRLFHSKGVSATGCYSIWLCDSGEWKNIIIDDYIPCTKLQDVYFPRFSRSKGNDMWVLLLEKAYAKMYGTYFSTNGGYQGEALSALTGAPVTYLQIKKDHNISPLEQVWSFIGESLQNRFVLTAGSRKEIEKLNNKAMGIVSGHAYAILDAKEVDMPTGNKQKIIKMRNPWGNQEWNGEWGDHSPLWTPEIRVALKYKPDVGDGVFWISLEDFHKHFFQPCSCEVRDNFKSSFLVLGRNQKQSNFLIAKMRVESFGFAYISVHQKRRKHFRNKPGYVYSYLRVILARLDENEEITSVIDGNYDNSQSVMVKRELEKGDYLVFIEVEWIQKFFNEVVLTAYSAVDVNFQEETLTEYHIPSLYEKLIETYIVQSENKEIKKIQLKSAENPQEAFKYILPTLFGLGAILLVNEEKEKILYYRIQAANLNNIKIFLPSINILPYDIILRPGEKKTLILKAETSSLKFYGFRGGDIYTFVEIFDQEKLKQACRNKGKKIEPFENEPVEIYTYNYAGGSAIYYINDSLEKTLVDEIQYETSNILINNEDKNKFNLTVLPGKDTLVDIKFKNLFRGTKLNMIPNPKFLEDEKSEFREEHFI